VEERGRQNVARWVKSRSELRLFNGKWIGRPAVHMRCEGAKAGEGKPIKTAVGVSVADTVVPKMFDRKE